MIMFMSMYVALLLKVDVSTERASSQKVFEASLVAVHACLILTVVVEAMVLGCSLRETQIEEPRPRARPKNTLQRNKEASLVEYDSFAADVVHAA